MGSIVLYILEWAFALIVLLTIYKAAFSGTTFYRFNRFYLLGATVLSALAPLSLPQSPYRLLPYPQSLSRNQACGLWFWFVCIQHTC